MELHKTPERTKSGFVLLDQNMRLVKPVNEYLDFQALRGRAENTLLAYGKDLKTFFEFLEQRKLQYDQVTANMIRDYVEYLRAPDVNTVYLFVESKRSPATINRMISTLHGFYGYHVSMYGIVNPVITEDINSPNGIFRGILYHTRKSNYTRQSVFKVKESEYRIHLFTTTEMRQMHDVLPTARDKLLFKLLAVEQFPPCEGRWAILPILTRFAEKTACNLGSRARLCDGYCTLPIQDGKPCGRFLSRQKCYLCSRYITTLEDLNAHKEHLQELEECFRPVASCRYA